MLSYPASLPKPLSNSYQAGGVDPWVEDRPEVGSARRRKRFTRSLKTFAFTLRLTTEQLATLKTFYETTLDDGVHSFSWTDPADSTVYIVRFNERFGLRNISPNAWEASIALTEV